MKRSLMALALVVCFGSSPVLAQQGDDFIYDQGAWQRLVDHAHQLDLRIDSELQSGAISPVVALQIQKELDQAFWHALYQHDRPNQPPDYDVRMHFRHVHVALGGDWGHVFEPR